LVAPDTAVLGAFIAGTLDSAELATLQDHLAGCDECLSVVAHAAHGMPSSPRSTNEELAASQAQRALTGDRDADRFERRGLIARGGMGAVYHGVDRGTGRRVAIKRLPFALRVRKVRAEPLVAPIGRISDFEGKTMRSKFGYWG
jgi:hypothetical protein